MSVTKLSYKTGHSTHKKKHVCIIALASVVQIMILITIIIIIMKIQVKDQFIIQIQKLEQYSAEDNA